MGEEADDIVMSFGLTTEEAKQYSVVKGKFEAHFVVKRNVIFERAKFNLRSQQNKMVSQWIISQQICIVLRNVANLEHYETILSEIESW